MENAKHVYSLEKKDWKNPYFLDFVEANDDTSANCTRHLFIAIVSPPFAMPS